jgi:hypothetical protein
MDATKMRKEPFAIKIFAVLLTRLLEKISDSDLNCPMGTLYFRGLTPEQAVSDWYCEIQNYNFDQPILNLGFVSKACMPPVNGHFTQVVWKETTLLGCASNTCQDKDGHQGTLWVCEYSPPGNNPQTLSQNVLKPTCQ